MDSFKRFAQDLLDEITGMLSAADVNTFTSLVNCALAARYIEVAGEGRARYVAAAFVRKLSGLGRAVALHGEAVSRPAGKGDLVIIVSFKGARGPLTSLADAARKRGARVYVLVGESSSVLAASADGVIPISPQSRTPFEAIAGGGRASRLAFDEALLVYLDSVILAMQEMLRVTPDESEDD